MKSNLIVLTEKTQATIKNDALRNQMSQAINRRNVIDINPLAYLELADEILKDELDAAAIMNFLISKREKQDYDTADLVMCTLSDRSTSPVLVELLNVYGIHPITDKLFLYGELTTDRYGPRHNVDEVDTRNIFIVSSNGSTLRYSCAGQSRGNKSYLTGRVIDSNATRSFDSHVGSIHASDDLVKQIVSWLVNAGNSALVDELIAAELIPTHIVEWLSFYGRLSGFATQLKGVTSTTVTYNKLSHGPMRPHNRYFIECLDDSLIYPHYSPAPSGEVTEARVVKSLGFLEGLEAALELAFGEVSGLTGDEDADMAVVLTELMKPGYNEFSVFRVTIDGFPYTVRVNIGRNIVFIPTDCEPIKDPNMHGYDGYDCDGF